MEELEEQLICEDNPNVVQYVLAILGAFEENENARQEDREEAEENSVENL